MSDPKEEIKALYRIYDAFYKVHRTDIDRDGWPSKEEQRYEYAEICGQLNALTTLWIRMGYHPAELK